jgi:hypothetical protein
MNHRRRRSGGFVKTEIEGRAWLQDDPEEEEDVHLVHCMTYQIRFKNRLVNYVRQSITNELK